MSIHSYQGIVYLNIFCHLLFSIYDIRELFSNFIELILQYENYMMVCIKSAQETPVVNKKQQQKQTKQKQLKKINRKGLN